MTAQNLLALAFCLFAAGGLAALLCNRVPRAAAYATGLSGLLGSAAGIASALPVLLGQAGFRVDLGGGLPLSRLIIEVDPLSAFMVLVICFLAAAVFLYSLSYIEEYRQKNPGLLGFLINLFVVAMILVVTAGDALYFLIAWELMTLVSYFLVIYEGDRPSLAGGWLYFLVAHAGTALIMVAFLLLANGAGSFAFSAFRTAALSPALRSAVFLLAFIGFCAKAGVVPLHFWLPEAHSAAPSNVSALLSGVMIKTAIYGIIRVTVSFLGAGAWWWGFLILSAGVVSTVLGVIYALAQHDIKRLLAYHSVENIGIILMGIGAGILGLSLGIPALVAVGLLAGLYHLFNHAVFKGLLFLGAGSVVHSTGTRNFESLGGLAGVMPYTAILFLIGAVSISALPPLNGFVSEWFTYQSLLTLGMAGGVVEKLAAALFAALLAMAGALTAMCFVKTYGITFAGPPRSSAARSAREVPLPMILGQSLLAAGCFGLGLGLPVVAPMIARVASSLSGPLVQVSSGLTAFPGNPAQGLLSTPLIALSLIGMLLLPFLVLAIQGNAGLKPRTDPTPWACGYRYQPEMASTARSFAQVVQAIFRPFYLVSTSLRGTGAGGEYFQTRMEYQVRQDDFWAKYCGRPLSWSVSGLSRLIGALQSGNVRLYCFYIIMVLIVLLAVVRL